MKPQHNNNLKLERLDVLKQTKQYNNYDAWLRET